MKRDRHAKHAPPEHFGNYSRAKIHQLKQRLSQRCLKQGTSNESSSSVLLRTSSPAIQIRLLPELRQYYARSVQKVVSLKSYKAKTEDISFRKEIERIDLYEELANLYPVLVKEDHHGLYETLQQMNLKRGNSK